MEEQLTGQMSMTDILESYKKPLSVIYNNAPALMSYTDIFDTEKYDTLRAVTFVASAGFLYEAAKDFAQVDIVIGIPDSSMQKAVKKTLYKYFTLGNQIMTDKKFPTAGKDRICDRTFNLYFANLVGEKLPIFHSKIFIMANSVTGENRVVVGSVNLTKSAMSNHIDQYEEALVYDNDNILYPYYTNRYNFIYSLADENFVPDNAKAAYKNGDIKQLVELTKTNSEKILKELSEGRVRAVCNNNEILQYATTEDAEEKTDENGETHVLEIVKASVKKADEEIRLKGPKQIMTQSKIVSVINEAATEESNGRCQITYKDKDFFITRSGETEDISEPILRPEKDEVKQNLINIFAFADAYKERIVNSDVGDDNATGIMESIIFALESPFLWMLREQEQNTAGGKRENIPLVLYMQSEAFGGKSNLSEYIVKLLTNDIRNADYYTGKQLGSGSMVFDNMMIENNVFPYILDDGPKDLMINSRNIEKLKHVANTKEKEVPALITTTNYKKTIPTDVARRVYRIPLPGTFDNSPNKMENDMYFCNILDQCSDAVFREITCRFKETDHIDIHNPDGNTDDFLYPVRHIFEDMAKEFGIQLPTYFPKRPFAQILREQNAKIWRDHYGWEKRNGKYVGYSAKLNLIKFDLSQLNSRKKTSLLNSIEPTIIEPSSGVDTITLKADMFFDWMGEPKPSLFIRHKMPW